MTIVIWINFYAIIACVFLLCAIITAKTGSIFFSMFNARLTPEEKAALELRGLYESYGYTFYRMGRFEEYDFYADKKDFLTSKSILIFTDINGRLMALRPDVTLSVIRHAGAGKYYYDEKVYRVPRNGSTFREIAQTGIERIGHLMPEDIREVIELAILSLRAVSGGRRSMIDVADAGIISTLVAEDERRPEILKCLAGKDISGLEAISAPIEVVRLAGLGGIPELAMPYLTPQIRDIVGGLVKYHDQIRIDFSAVNSLNYYNGIVFKGFIEGIPEAVLSGGQYDGMLQKMGHSELQGAGFAVYLDMIGR